MRTTKRLAVLTSIILILASCETPAPTAPQQQTSANAAADRMTPLKYNEILRLLAGNTHSSPNEPGNDQFARPVTFVRSDLKKAYRFYPNWQDGSRPYEVGKYFRQVLSSATTKDGIVHRNVDAFCLQDEMELRPRYCYPVFTSGGRYFMGSSGEAQLVIENGFDAFLNQAVPQAVKSNDNIMLRLFAADFGIKRPSLVATYQASASQERARLRAELQAREAKIRAQRAAETAERRAASQRAEAECQRDFGKSCAAAGMDMFGSMLGAGLSAIGASGSPSSGGSVSMPDVEGTYELVCRERNLMDVDNFRRGTKQSCRGEIGQCQTQFREQIESRYGSLNEACKSQFGSTYSYEEIDYDL